MARRYSVSSGQVSLAASTTKILAQLATGSTITNTLIGASISGDSIATGAGAIPVRVQLVRPTAASSGGSTATPAKMNKSMPAAATTARVGDTSAGSTPAVLEEWEVSPVAGQLIQLPLGREYEMDISDFLELKVISQAGMTTCNLVGNLQFEE